MISVILESKHYQVKEKGGKAIATKSLKRIPWEARDLLDSNQGVAT